MQAGAAFVHATDSVDVVGRIAARGGLPLGRRIDHAYRKQTADERTIRLLEGGTSVGGGARAGLGGLGTHKHEGERDGRRRGQARHAGSSTEPSSRIVQRGLCATSHGWPSGSVKAAE
jgi:hypothetical protein